MVIRTMCCVKNNVLCWVKECDDVLRVMWYCKWCNINIHVKVKCGKKKYTLNVAWYVEMCEIQHRVTCSSTWKHEK